MQLRVPLVGLRLAISRNLHKKSTEKVVEFMKQFEQVLSDFYPDDAQSEEFKEYVRSGLRKSIYSVNSGNSQEVERRFKYYTDYN